MSVSSQQISFELANAISPIILTGGIATARGGALPIVSLLGSPSSSAAVSASGSPSSLRVIDVANDDEALDEFFARFVPVPGSDPFANQAIAANALIAQGLRISLQMICPATANYPYPSKLAIIMALQAQLQQHQNMGGLYTVITPAFIYTNCMLLNLRDVSTGGTSQVAEQAFAALNGTLSTINNGTRPANGTPSAAGGLSVSNPTTLLNSSISPQSVLQ